LSACENGSADIKKGRATLRTRPLDTCFHRAIRIIPRKIIIDSADTRARIFLLSKSLSVENSTIPNARAGIQSAMGMRKSGLPSTILVNSKPIAAAILERIPGLPTVNHALNAENAMKMTILWNAFSLFCFRKTIPNRRDVLTML